MNPTDPTNALIALIPCFLISTARAIVPDGASSDLALGQAFADSIHFTPVGLAVDRVTQKVFVSDGMNNRVLRFGSAAALENGAPAEAVFGQPDFGSVLRGTTPDRFRGPRGLCVDASGRLWVADSGNNRVLHFSQAAALATGAAASGVLGQVDFAGNGEGCSASQLRSPMDVEVDPDGALYVADEWNHRVLRFDHAATLANGGEAAAVFGQANFTSGNAGISATRMSNPYALALERDLFLNTRLWVADTENDRVLLFSDAGQAPNGAAAAKVLGRANFAINDSPQIGPASMLGPRDIATDGAGCLYVADSGFERVLRFDNASGKATGAAADGVLGKPNFLSEGTTQGAGGLGSPEAVACNGTARLWIGDWRGRRLVRHESARTKVNGAPADSVLGDETTAGDSSRPVYPTGIAIDPVSGKLFVSDNGAHRVLRYGSVEALAAGATPEAVFGQTDFTGRSFGTNFNRMHDPRGLSVDGAGRLWVADTENHRVLRFDDAAHRVSGVYADGILGTALGLNASGMDYPMSVLADGSRLWVADSNHARVLRFENAANKPNFIPADGVLGQANFTTQVYATDAQHLGGPRALALTGTTLWVLDNAFHRVLKYSNAAAKTNGTADGVLGQPNFTESALGSGANAIANAFGLMAEPCGRLWLVDGGLRRVVRWEDADHLPNGTLPSGLLGQPDFGVTEGTNAADRFLSPHMIARDATGHLWVTDQTTGRIARFSPKRAELNVSRNSTQTAFSITKLVPGIRYNVQTSGDFQTWSTIPLTAPAGGFAVYLVPDGSVPGGNYFMRVEEP